MGDRLTGNGHVGDLAPAYALGALEPEEREWVDRHRRVCPVCDRLLVAEERMVSLLPFLVRAAPPPSPDVKVALLARVAHAHRAGASLRSTDVAALPPNLTIPPSRPAPAVRASRHGPDVRPNRRAGWATALLTAPLVLAVAVLGTLAVQFHAQAEARGARAERFGAALEQALAGGGTVQKLYPGPAAPEAKGWVVTDAGQRTGTFYMRAAKARAGERYRLLASPDGAGKPVALATVELDGRGRGAATLSLDRPLSAYRDLTAKLLRPGEKSGGPALRGVVATPVVSPEDRDVAAPRRPTKPNE